MSTCPISQWAFVQWDYVQWAFVLVVSRVLSKWAFVHSPRRQTEKNHKDLYSCKVSSSQCQTYLAPDIQI